MDPNPYATSAIAPEAGPGSLVRSFKNENLSLVNWAALVLIGLPIVAGIVGTIYFPDWKAAMLAVPILFAAMFVLSFCLRWRIDVRYGSLGNKVASQLRAEQIDPAAWNGQFVQFAPTGKLRFYDRHSEWDVGYLFFFRGGCTYVGTQTRFSVPRSAIREITIGHGTFELPFSYQVHVHWENPTTGGDESFSIWPGVPQSQLVRFPEVQAFAEKIRAWQVAENSGSEAPTWSALPVPELESVKSMTLEQANPIWQVVSGSIGLGSFLLWASFSSGNWWPFCCCLSFLLYVIYSVVPRYMLCDEIVSFGSPSVTGNITRT